MGRPGTRISASCERPTRIGPDGNASCQRSPHNPCIDRPYRPQSRRSRVKIACPLVAGVWIQVRNRLVSKRPQLPLPANPVRGLDLHLTLGLVARVPAVKPSLAQCRGPAWVCPELDRSSRERYLVAQPMAVARTKTRGPRRMCPPVCNQPSPKQMKANRSPQLGHDELPLDFRGLGAK